MRKVAILNNILRVILVVTLITLGVMVYTITTAGSEALRTSPAHWLNLATYPLYAVVRRQHRRAILQAGLIELRDGLQDIVKLRSQVAKGA